MGCKSCKHARKACNEDAIACKLWSERDASALVSGAVGWDGEVYQGWAYLSAKYYDGPAEKHGMMINNCILMPKYGHCNMQYKNISGCGCVIGESCSIHNNFNNDFW